MGFETTVGNLNTEEYIFQKLSSRAKNHLDWMWVGDQKSWQGQLSGFIDIDSLNHINLQQ